MKLLKKLTAIIILLSMLITLNSPIISYAEGETGTNTTGGTTTGEQTEEIGTEYEIKEEETWDVSKNGDGSVIAKWTLEDRTITISGSGETKNWTNSSNEDWHNGKYRYLIEKVKIEEGVTSIGWSAFKGCSSLTHIAIPNSVTSVGWSAFSGCRSLKNITIPSGVTSIENEAFYGCSSLTNIEIPNSVTSIEYYAFYGCSSLENINVEENNLKYISIDGVLYNNNKTNLIYYPDGKQNKSYSISNSITSIENGAFSGCSILENIEIPSSVTSIKEDTFSGCSSLKNIEIPNSVVSIGDSAFSGCSSLENIEIPNTVKEISRGAFSRCSSLTSIEIPSSVTSIGSEAFLGCSSLTNIIIPNSVTSIEYRTFEGCNSLTNITIPNSVTSIGYEAFYGCSSLENIQIPNSVISIGNSAFGAIKGPIICNTNSKVQEYCENEKKPYILLDNNTSNVPKVYEINKKERWDISKNGDENVIAVWNLEDRSITISGSGEMKNWTSDSNDDWHNNQYTKIIEKVKIEEGVRNIGWRAFSGCSSLTNIEIQNSVTSIGWSAFSGCRSLKNIAIPNSVTDIESGAFEECSSLANITIPNSVTYIGNGAFEGCSSLTNITIPSGVTMIGSYAYDGCSSLENITIPNSVTSIGDYSFSGCSSLTNIRIPSSVTDIQNCSFDGCSSLENINVEENNLRYISIDGVLYNNNKTKLIYCPDGKQNKSYSILNSITSIEKRAFSGCSNLENIEIPNSVTNIGSGAFSGCSNLASIDIPNSVTSIQKYTFYGCSSLENITIPHNVTNIGNEAFYGCSSLTNIKIPNSVTSIGSSAFSGCNSIIRISIPNSVTDFGSDAFEGYNGLKICKRNTEAHKYAESKKIGYILDEKMPKVTYTPSEFEKAQKQVVVKIEVTDITGVEENNIKYLWSTKEEVSIEEVNNTLTNGEEISSPEGVTGTYYIYVYAKDNLGNEGIAKSRAIKLDNTAPTIELAENKYYQKPNIQDEKLGTVFLTKDGNKVETYKYGETIFGEGTYELTATDEAGNSTTKEFILQKIPTGEEGLNYEITPSELTNQDVTLNVSKKDATNTELEIELSTDGKNYEVGNTKTITENGKVYARLGKEGAYGEAIEIEITNIDKKAPVIEGVKNKRSYARKATPKAVDENLESVKLEKEGQEVEGYENGTEITELGNYKITATDKVGNKTEVEFYIKDIPSTEEVVEYTVSPEGLTNQDVKVSVTKKENEEYQDLIVQMSTDGENYEAVTEKTITENGTVYIRIVKEEEGNTIEGEVIEVEIKNIDKTAPEAQVEYSNKELTNQNVTATITTNEEIQEVEGWTRGEDRKTLTKEYSENKTEEVTVKDIAGNSTKVTIEITNIDKTAPEGQVTYSETNPTNKNVTATITANEEIQEVEGWTISQDKKKLTKEYNANKTEKVIIKDTIGNEREVDVKVLNIDRTAPLASVNYSTKNKTNKNVTVTITANEKVQGITGWTLSNDNKRLTKEYSANMSETITIKDLAGNSLNATIEITNIDKIAPTVNVEYSTTNLTNGNVTATIESNEEIQGITGWTISNDKKTLTRIYQSNAEERIEIKDVAGNTVYKNISIKNVDKASPVITGVEEGKVYKDSVIATTTDANPGTLLLEKDGTKVEGYANGKEIIEEGTYRLTATDKVGNATIVNFTIKYSRGDININNNIDTGDVLALLRYIAQNTSKKVAERHPDWNFNEKNKIIGDVNRNGKIDTGDVLTLQRYQAAKSSKTIADKHPEWLNIE